MKVRIEPDMRRALARMSRWLGLTLVLAFFGMPSIVPPGNVWTPGLTLAVIALLIGAYRAALVYRGRLLFLLYGCLGAIPIMPVFLPDNRDYIGIALGHESIWSYVASAIGFVIVMGIVCRIVAACTHLRQDALARRADWRLCEECGYLLYGLNEPRCPECGTAFQHEIPSPPDPRE